VASRRPRVTLALWGVLLAVGLYVFVWALDREGFPPVNTPFVEVETDYFVDDIERVDADIAQPLLDAYSDVEGIGRIQTFSRPNRLFAFIEFESDYTSDDGVALLLATDQLALPDGVVLEISPENPTKFADIYVLIVTVADPQGPSRQSWRSRRPSLPRACASSTRSPMPHHSAC